MCVGVRWEHRKWSESDRVEERANGIGWMGGRGDKPGRWEDFECKPCENGEGKVKQAWEGGKEFVSAYVRGGFCMCLLDVKVATLSGQTDIRA